MPVAESARRKPATETVEDALQEHHVAEANFLIDEIRRLARLLDEASA